MKESFDGGRRQKEDLEPKKEEIDPEAPQDQEKETSLESSREKDDAEKELTEVRAEIGEMGLREGEQGPELESSGPVAEPISPKGFEKLQKDRLNVLVANARHILGPDATDQEVKDLARQTFREYGRALLFSANPFRSKEKLAEMTDILGQENIAQTLDEHGRAIVVTSHMSYFPTAMKMVPSLLPENTRGSTLVEKNPIWPIVNFFQKLTKRFKGKGSSDKKFEMMVKESQNPRTLTSLVHRLKGGSAKGKREILFMAADRGDLSPDRKRTKVDFFDSQVNFPSGPASLSRLTGAPIIPTYIVREGDRFTIKVGDPIRVDPDKDRTAATQQATQEFADFFAQGVAEHPEQWPVYRHDFWPDQKDFKESK